MNLLATTPEPPYYAVIFTSIRTGPSEAYSEMAKEMNELVRHQPGFLGVEHAREELGITVSYWKDLDSIRLWKEQLRHRAAQELGKSQWYANYRIRIALVSRDYGSDI